MIRLISLVAVLFLWGAFACACDSGDSEGGSDVAIFAGEDTGSQGEREGSADAVTEADLPPEEEDIPPACTSECDFAMQKQCASETGYQECLPEGNCLAWSVEVPCEEGFVCEEGECVQGFGVLDCIAVSKCVAGCEQDEPCQEACFLQGSEQGQADFEAFLVCTDTNCGQFFEQEKPAAGSKCTLDNCENEYKLCVEVGDASCSETLQCMQGCNEDGDCLGACVTQADYDALVKLSDILVCFENNCPDPATWQECATSSCLMQSMACL